MPRSCEPDPLVDHGQFEAAQSLGMRRAPLMRRIVLPQAMRVIVPPTGNETISMLRPRRSRSSSPIPSSSTRQRTSRPGHTRRSAVHHGELLVPAHDHVLTMVSTTWSAITPAAPRTRSHSRDPKAQAQPDDTSSRAFLSDFSGRVLGACSDDPCRGRPQALRPARSAQGDHPRGRAARGDVPPRAVRVGQVDLPSLHQPPREDQFRSAVRRRVARRVPRTRRSSPRASRTRSLPPAYRDRMVFQRFNLFPHMTALENVVVAPVLVKKDSRAVATTRARSLLDRVGLSSKVDSYPNQLSGGQQQRSPSPGRSRWSRSSCSSTSPPAPSILSSSAKSST